MINQVQNIIANCDNNNEINIGINQEHSVTTRNQQDDSADTTTLNGQALEELTAEEAMNGLLSGSSDGTGEPLLNLERNIVTVTFTNNDNDCNNRRLSWRSTIIRHNH